MIRGKFGRVMKCRHNVSGEIFAAKFVTCTRREDRYVNIIIIIIIVVIIIVLVIIVTYTRRQDRYVIIIIIIVPVIIVIIVTIVDCTRRGVRGLVRHHHHH